MNVRLMGPGHVTGLQTGQVIRTDPHPGRGRSSRTTSRWSSSTSPACRGCSPRQRRPRACSASGRGCASSSSARSPGSVSTRRAAARCRCSPSTRRPTRRCRAARPRRQLGVGARPGHRRVPAAVRRGHRRCGRRDDPRPRPPRALAARGSSAVASWPPPPTTSPASCRRSSSDAWPGSASTSPPTRRRRLAPGVDPRRRAPSVELPVYYSWEFATGRNGDFQSLAMLLRARPLPRRRRRARVDVSASGVGVPCRDRPCCRSAAARAGARGRRRRDRGPRARHHGTSRACVAGPPRRCTTPSAPRSRRS